MTFTIDEYVKGDCFNYLPTIPNDYVDLIFTSCPDLSQTKYDKTDSGIKGYKDFQKKVMNEFSRIVKPSGFVVICQTDRRINGAILSNHLWYSKCMDECGMKLKDYKLLFVIRSVKGICIISLSNICKSSL